MEWHINDLSLSGQFQDPLAFRSTLEPLLQLRHRDPLLQGLLYCSRTLHERRVTHEYDLKSAVRATGDKTYIGLVLEWANKNGPFWDDDRQFAEDDYFEYQREDVTNQGLGEASRRKLAGREANAYSFEDSGFERSPLTVQHGLSEEPIETIDITNHWQVEQLRAALDSCRALNCWEDIQEEIIRRFDQLVIATNTMTELFPIPFSLAVSDRIFHLLNILNDLVMESDENGKLSCRGEEIWRNNFAGASAERTPLFKPESPEMQRSYRTKLTFRDPSNSSNSIFCHWHGKIQTPQIRIHFEWPRPTGQRAIKVVYIGPKITKW